MSAFPEPIRRCLAEAVAASGPLLERCLEKAVIALQEAQDKSAKTEERQEFSEARYDLLPLCTGWVARYPQALQLAFDSGGPRSAPPAPPAGPSLTLALVDEAEVDQQLEAIRLTAQVQSMVEQSLGELDALVSSALGLPAVRREQNPVRPEVFAQTLRSLMSESEAARKWQSLWIRYLAKALGSELGDLYRRLSVLLSGAGVTPVAYRMVSAAAGPAPLRAVAPDAQRPGNEAPGMQPGGGAGGGSGGAGVQGHPGDGPASANAGGGSQGTGSQGGAGQSRGQDGPAGQRSGNTGMGSLGEAAPARPKGDPRLRGSALADLSRGPLGDELVREFLKRDDGQGQAPLAQGFYARVASELAQLEAAAPEPPPTPDPVAEARYQQLPVVERPLQQITTDTPLDRALWGDYSQARQRMLHRTRLKKQAQKVDQVLGLELVRKLVNQVAADPRLLPPVRQSIIALEPSLLRLALLEPRFFSDDKHPGRCLVERVAARSLRYNDEFSPDFKDFTAAVAARFKALNGNEGADSKEFAAALATMESAWTALDTEDDRKRAQAMEAVRFAEQRQAAANQIAQVMAQRPDIGGVPQAVQEFLYGPWSLVMAQARLSDALGQIDPGAHGSVVTDLLWSAKPEAALRHPTKLMQLIPSLIQRLRAGLRVIGQTPQECSEFFTTLERLHRPVLELRTRRRGDAEPAPKSEAAADLPRAVPRQQPKTSDTPWMARRELAAVGFPAGASDPASTFEASSVLPESPVSVLPATDSGSAPLSQAARPPSPRAAAPAARIPSASGATPLANADGTAATQDLLDPTEAARLMATLQEGCWVDLFAGKRWLRARLAWTSKSATLFMFVSQGGQPHTMTRRICERLLRERQLRPVGMHGVVDHAINVMGQVATPSNAAVALRA